jgi:hypothetical protein
MRYSNTKILRVNKDNGALGVRYYSTTKYPSISLSEDDIYVITVQGDRYDLLANQYYNDVNLWWIIPIANPEIGFNSIHIPVGSQVRIPTNVQEIVSSYLKLNGYE